MSGFLKITASLLLLTLLVFFVGARNGWLTPSEEELRLRYALRASQFIDLEGATIHVTDEGRGVPVVLMHGSFGNLRDWDDWAAALAGDYRVLRFDLPRFGLSGPLPAGRGGLEADVAVLDALVRELDLGPMILVSTSSSAASAMAWAAENPQRLRGMVLSNFAIGWPFGAGSSHFSPWFKFLLRIDPWFAGWRPRAFFREVMGNNFHDPARITHEDVARWADLNNRAQRMPPPVAPVDPQALFGRAPDDLARITVPTLLLWSEYDEELPVDTVALEALDLVAAADRELVVVGDCGHMLPLECGAESAELTLPFLERVAAMRLHEN